MFSRNRSYIPPYTAAQVAIPSARHATGPPTDSSRRLLRLHAPPFAHGVQRARKSGEQIRLQHAAPRPTPPESRRAHPASPRESRVSSPAVTIAARRTSERVASSRSRNVARVEPVGIIVLPPGVSDRSARRQADSRISPTTSPRVFRTGRRRNSSRRGGSVCRQHVEQLENAKHRRELRALRAVVDLYREADALLRDRDGVHALGADLRDQRDRPSLRSAPSRSGPCRRRETGACASRCTMRDGISSLVARRAREARPGARHVLERKRERDDAASVDRLADVGLRPSPPTRRSRCRQQRCTWMVAPLVAVGLPARRSARARAWPRACRSSCCACA